MNKRGHVLNALLLAVGVGFVLEPAVDRNTAIKIAQVTVPIVLGALFPDVDTAFGKHRKTLHSLTVLGIVAAYPIVFNNLQYVWVGVLTHYILDLIGSRRGIALFHPLSSSEYSLPFGVTTSSDYADLVTVVITALEIAAFWAVHTYVVDLNVDVATVSQAIGMS
ncbi:LexA-binding, inner membrane-associated putative hydrolase [Halopenitus malekzadehii]|uniref:LexA-binding, inner membrane-associated putative hydrolase n=1 Tax=Halopenitus malekzadehii TaxID=1267564 RepID=A0A1H6HYJ3_9EURY|nr:metal-dependent hydrolase [Halopenitus malekzadehii]SEH39365.1 LexA-binding, inner membrane-associated putative hydrolase [Halopenitus malekzadehii]